MSVIMGLLLEMTLPPCGADAGGTSIVSWPGRARMILVVASITNVQSLPGPSFLRLYVRRLVALANSIETMTAIALVQEIDWSIPSQPAAELRTVAPELAYATAVLGHSLAFL
jgi:hypothetical protein